MRKLSQRARYYLTSMTVSAIGVAIWAVALRPEFFGENLPEFMRIGTPIFMGVVSVAYFLTRNGPPWVEPRPPKQRTSRK